MRQRPTKAQGITINAPKPQMQPSRESFWLGKDRTQFTAEAEEYFKQPGRKLSGFLYHVGFGPES
jgi:hypothetical protein